MHKRFFLCSFSFVQCSYMTTDCRSSIKQRRNPRETADLTSIHELVNGIDSNCHLGMEISSLSIFGSSFCTWVMVSSLQYLQCLAGLLDTIRNCTYIGMADDVFALLQHNTHLYLANVVNLRYHSLFSFSFLFSYICCYSSIFYFLSLFTVCLFIERKFGNSLLRLEGWQSPLLYFYI